MTFGRYRSILAIGPFRQFWLAFTASVLGDAITRVALTWYVYERTGSARAVGWLMVCYTGPILIGGLAAGALLDRFDRRLVMAVDNLVRGLAVGMVPVLHLTGQLQIWQVYVVAACYGLLMMVSLAGGPSLVPDLVGEDDLATANALEMLSFTVAGVIGPPLAGLLIALTAAPNVIALDCLSYLIFGSVLISQFRNGPARADAANRTAAGYTLADAVRLTRRTPVLLSTTLMFTAFNIGNGCVLVALPVLAREGLHGGATLYGVLLGALAAGEVISSLTVGGLRFRPPLGILICLAQILSGAAVSILLKQHIAVALVGLGLFGLCSAPLTIWAQTLRMQVIPAQLRGRTFALLRTIMQGGGPIGGAIAGVLLPAIGLSAVVALAAGAIGLPGFAGLNVRGLRGADQQSAAEPETALLIDGAAIEEATSC